MISTRILGAILLATFVAGGGKAIAHEGVSTLNPVIDQPGVADFTKWLAVSTVVMAAATIALAVFSLLQAVIMRRTARRQLRAYVFITTAEIGDIDDSQNLHASVSIKNSGQTPAYDLINRGAITIREARLRGDLWPEDKDASLSKTALGPGEVLGKYFSARPLTTEERAAVRSGTHAIYVYGEILYKDAFRRRRHSRYRFMHGGETAIRSRQLVICDEGNEAN
jgi:hypothetical protein